MGTITFGVVPLAFSLLTFFAFNISWCHAEGSWFAPVVSAAVGFLTYFMMYGIFSACGCY